MTFGRSRYINRRRQSLQEELPLAAYQKALASLRGLGL